MKVKVTAVPPEVNRLVPVQDLIGGYLMIEIKFLFIYNIEEPEYLTIQYKIENIAK